MDVSPISICINHSALPSKRRQIQSLVKEGRLEFTSGTWVMTDEATPHLYSMLDQMIEGTEKKPTFKETWVLYV